MLLIGLLIVLLTGPESGPETGTASVGAVHGSPETAARWPTPEAAFEALTQAYAKKDWKTLYSTMTPEGQRAAVGMGAMFAVIGSSHPDMRAILQRHGLEDIELKSLEAAFSGAQKKDFAGFQKELRQIVDHIADQEGFFCDAMSVITSPAVAKDPGVVGMIARKFVQEFLEAVGTATVSHVVINGDKASGLGSAGRRRHFRVLFLRIGGGWRVGDDGMNFPIR